MEAGAQFRITHFSRQTGSFYQDANRQPAELTAAFANAAVNNMPSWAGHTAANIHRRKKWNKRKNQPAE